MIHKDIFPLLLFISSLIHMTSDGVTSLPDVTHVFVSSVLCACMSACQKVHVSTSPSVVLTSPTVVFTSEKQSTFKNLINKRKHS